MGKTRQQSSGSDDGAALCRRLVELRRLRYGERGKSAFARDLGIPVTTYVHYEAGRLPPVDLLIRAAHVTGVRLEWLLTGTGSRDPRPESKEPDPLTERLSRLLQRSPRLRPAVEASLQRLEQSQSEEASIAVVPPDAREGLIPVVGSTAAGLAHYWRELEQTHGGPEADARLEAVLSSHFEQTSTGESHRAASTSPGPDRVALVQYSRPDAAGFLEFLSAVGIKRRYPRAVAWRIDGESMAPRYQDGDLVITSPDQPAVEMQPCVCRQKGQIGVNCKLFQTQGDEVLLIPINEASPVQRIPRESIQWAWRVLSSVRLDEPRT